MRTRTKARYYDAKFPVDINLYVSETEPANGDLYYGNNDFIGKYGESALVAGGGLGSGIMVGRLRGWGYCEFSYQLEGIGVNMSFSAGIIEGEFQGKRGDQIPEDLAGDGSEDAFGTYFMSGTAWDSFQIREDGTKDLKFKGSSEGISIGVPGVNGSLGTFETRTSLLYPKRIE
ncbi:MAG: hypothetical protein GY816_00835 [Cytophagales bacterium]|nr:hypothetical protein [Cytophagales bacterium]